MTHPWKSLEGLPRASWALAVATLVNRAGTMAVPLLAIFLREKQGLSPEVVSAIFLAFGLGMFAGGPVAGRGCDRFGARAVLVGCLASSGAVVLLLPFAHSTTALAVIVFGFGFTGEGVRPASMTLASTLAPPERRKSAFVLHRLAVNLGMSIGPAAGGIIAAIGYRYAFWIDGATSLVAAALLVATVPAVIAKPSGDPSRAQRGWFSDRRFVRFLVGVGLVGAVFSQLDAAAPLFMVETLKIPLERFGFLFAINTVMILLLEVRINAATERWSHSKSMAVGTLLIGVGFGGFTLVHGIAACAACIVVITFGEMILFPALSAFVADTAPEGQLGGYMGGFSMAFALANSIAPSLGQWTLQRAGTSVLWPATFGLAIVAALLLAEAAKSTSETAPHD